MNNEFWETRRKQRFSLRKFNIGLASVLLGFTVFGYNMADNSKTVQAAETTQQTAG